MSSSLCFYVNTTLTFSVHHSKPSRRFDFCITRFLIAQGVKPREILSTMFIHYGKLVVSLQYGLIILKVFVIIYEAFGTHSETIRNKRRWLFFIAWIRLNRLWGALRMSVGFSLWFSGGCWFFLEKKFDSYLASLLFSSVRSSDWRDEFPGVDIIYVERGHHLKVARDVLWK